MKYFLFAFLALLNLSAFNQTMVSVSDFDLGEINQLNEEILDLNITNNLSERVFLLRIAHSANFDVKYTSKTFLAGEAQIIRLKYRPKKKGKFAEEIALYFSSNADPITLTIKGEIQTVPKNLLQACPDFNNRENGARPTSTSLNKQKVEIKRKYINLLPNNTLAAEITEPTILEEITQVVPAPKPIIKKKPIQNKPIEEQKTDDVEVIIPTATQTNELDRNVFKPSNIIFLIDASMSMGKDDKLNLLKDAVKELLVPLREIDKIAIVSYRGEAELVLPPTSADRKETIQSHIEGVYAEGFTSGNKGLKMAYDIAKESYINNGNNQIYLVTDGAFKIGERNERIPRLIKSSKEKGIYLTCVGIKNERWTAKTLKEIAKNGNGNYLSLKDERDLNKLLIQIKEQSQVKVD